MLMLHCDASSPAFLNDIRGQRTRPPFDYIFHNKFDGSASLYNLMGLLCKRDSRLIPIIVLQGHSSATPHPKWRTDGRINRCSLHHIVSLTEYYTYLLDKKMMGEDFDGVLDRSIQRRGGSCWKESHPSTNLRYVPELVEDVDGEANDLFVQNLHVG